MDFSVELFTPADTVSIYELEKECFSSPWSENAIIESYRFGTAFFVAKKEGKIIGYAGVKKIIDEGYIQNVAVTKEVRNSGVGSALIKKITSWAKENGLLTVSLEVRVSNSAAIHLYEKEGYKKAGLRKKFYDCPKEDALILTLEV